MAERAFPEKTEVFIVGAGPAGATLAREMAQAGVQVLLCDRAKFPRGKTCAGGITVRALKLLPFDIRPVVERCIRGIAFTRNLEAVSIRRYSAPLMVTVCRESFDDFLLREAIQAGAHFVEGCSFLSLAAEGGDVRVETSAGSCRARYVVGADGAQGKVGRTVGLMESLSHILAIHSEVPASLMPDWESDFVHIDWGSVRRSYAYLFPKKSVLSMGVGGYGISTVKLKNYQQAFLSTRFQKEGLLPFGAAGFRIPLRLKRCPIQKGRVLLVGDAAGLADPFTGEGIYSALRSAQIAAGVLVKAIAGGWESLQEYEEEINRELMPGLEGSRLLREIFNLWPWFFHQKVTGNERWWQAMARLIRGERTFLDVKAKLGVLGSALHWMAR